MKNQVYAFLDSIGVVYDRESHAPAFHMDDCVEISNRMNAAHCKNYFLTTKSKKIHCLCLVRPNARFKTSDISKQAGTPRLSFADEESMLELLRVHPGSVSPMGLIFDPENRVRLLIDRELPTAPRLAFHPCDNTETLVLSTQDFMEKFLPAVNHEPTFIEIHDFEETLGEDSF